MSNDQRLKESAEYQRRRMMSQDEKNSQAVESCAKRLYDDNQKQGGHKPFEHFKRHMEKIAEKQDKINRGD